MWIATMENLSDPTPPTYVQRWSFMTWFKIFFSTKKRPRKKRRKPFKLITFLKQARWQFEPSAGGKSMNISQVKPSIKTSMVSMFWCLSSCYLCYGGVKVSCGVVVTEGRRPKPKRHWSIEMVERQQIFICIFWSNLYFVRSLMSGPPPSWTLWSGSSTRRSPGCFSTRRASSPFGRWRWAGIIYIV